MKIVGLRGGGARGVFGGGGGGGGGGGSFDKPAPGGPEPPDSCWFEDIVL